MTDKELSYFSDRMQTKFVEWHGKPYVETTTAEFVQRTRARWVFGALLVFFGQVWKP